MTRTRTPGGPVTETIVDPASIDLPPTLTVDITAIIEQMMTGP
ncbi:hypothetical protein ACPPVQ_04410 [Diaminobutyricibacter sp. McL0618]